MLTNGVNDRPQTLTLQDKNEPNPTYKKKTNHIVHWLIPI
jgi:hypothetical protein